MKRINKIITLLYSEGVNKSSLAIEFNVNEKTIENTIKKYNDELKKEKREIIYDKKLKKYRFDTLLPSKIPYEIFLKLMKSFVDDILIADDFKEFIDVLKMDNTIDMPLISTYGFSPLLKKIIMIKMAFTLNVSLKIQYIGHRKTIEEKYIKPNTLINTGYTHYLYATYSKENISNIGETRSFSIKGIKKIEINKFETEHLEKEATGNAWGIFKKDKYILLHLKSPASTFYKREEIANTGAFEFISEEDGGEIIMKMYYNNEQEIISLLQRWMPFISLHKQSELTDRIYEKIKNNFVDFTIQRKLF